jgi:Ca-activated chloride channel homolog
MTQNGENQAMKPNPILPDDPRLTAYALNEMEAGERAQFEPLLNADPAARQAVEEIRAAGELLASALENEPVMAPEPAKPPAARGRVIRFPQFYYMVSGLAAACFALFFVYWQGQQPPAEAKRKYVEVDLGAMKAASDSMARTEKEEALEKSSARAPVVAMGGAMAVNQVAAAEETVTLDAFAVSKDKKQDAARAGIATGGMAVASARLNAPAAAAPPPAVYRRQLADQDFSTEAYGYRKDNAYQRVSDQPLSTFSVDVDTAAYANVRRFLMQGQRPPADAVRIEELVNYFPYGYTPPTGNEPFSANLEVASAPWAPEHRLVRIGLKGRELSEAGRPAANLVFLLDVSGSMQQPNKLPLLKQSLRLLVDRLRTDDRVAIAVYAGASGLALPSTPANHKADILAAIDRLEAGGSTNGAMGIELAYDIAKANFIPGGVNRVILATDGDFNVGTTSEGELVRLIEEKARSGVFLTVLGFGMGNLKDSTLEQLADKGNGNYAYIDSLAEARKTLVEQAGGTLVTIAKDVKIQVEFNPLEVQAYRLIGYENRLLAKEDFTNDQVDAGEIGAGHTVTALYEVIPTGVELPAGLGSTEALKYQQPAGPVLPNHAEMLTVKIRYKEPDGTTSRPLAFPLTDSGARFEKASADFKFAAAVAGFGMLLRDSPHKGGLTLGDVTTWAQAGIGSDPGGYRNQFLGLIQRAGQLVQ